MRHKVQAPILLKEKEMYFPFGLWLEEKENLSIRSIVSFQKTQKIMINVRALVCMNFTFIILAQGIRKVNLIII